MGTVLQGPSLLDLTCVPERGSKMVRRVKLTGMTASDAKSRAVGHRNPQEKFKLPHEPTAVGYWLVVDIPVVALTPFGNLSSVRRGEDSQFFHQIGMLMSLAQVLGNPKDSYETMPGDETATFTFKDNKDQRTCEKVLGYIEVLMDANEKTIVGYRFHFFVQDPHINVAVGLDNLFSKNNRLQKDNRGRKRIGDRKTLLMSDVWNYPAKLSSGVLWVMQAAPSYRADMDEVTAMAYQPLNGQRPMDKVKQKSRKIGKMPAKKKFKFDEAEESSDDDPDDFVALYDKSKGMSKALEMEEVVEMEDPTPTPTTTYSSAMYYGPMHPASPYSLFDPEYNINTRCKKVIPEIHPKQCDLSNYKYVSEIGNVSYEFPLPHTVFKLNSIAEISPEALCLLRLPEPLEPEQQQEWAEKYEGTPVTNEEDETENRNLSQRLSRLMEHITQLRAGKIPNSNNKGLYYNEFETLKQRVSSQRAALGNDANNIRRWMQESTIPEKVMQTMSNSVVFAHQAYFKFYAESVDKGDTPYKHAPRKLIDPQLTFFGNLAEEFMWQLEKMQVTYLHGFGMGTFFSCLTASNPSYDIRPHFIFTGGPESGKSYIIELVEMFLIKGTYVRMTSITPKTFHTENGHEYTLKVVMFDEVPPQILGVSPDGKPNGQGDEAIKSIATKNKLEFAVFKSDEERKDRRTEICENDLRLTMIGATNVSPINMPDPITSRLCLRTVSTYTRQGYAKSDQKMKKGWFPAEDNDSNEFKLRCKWVQLLTHWTYALIDVGFLPQVDLTIANVVFADMLNELSRRGLSTVIFTRRKEALDQLVYVITIWYALHCVFFSDMDSEGGVEREFHPSHMARLADYLFCTHEIAVFAFTLFMDFFVDPNDAASIECYLFANKFYDGNDTAKFYKTDDQRVDTDYYFIPLGQRSFAEDPYIIMARTLATSMQLVPNTVHQSPENIAWYLKQLSQRLWENPATGKKVHVLKPLFPRGVCINVAWAKAIRADTYKNAIYNIATSVCYSGLKRKHVVIGQPRMSTDQTKFAPHMYYVTQLQPNPTKKLKVIKSIPDDKEEVTEDDLVCIVDTDPDEFRYRIFSEKRGENDDMLDTYLDVITGKRWEEVSQTMEFKYKRGDFANGIVYSTYCKNRSKQMQLLHNNFAQPEVPKPAVVVQVPDKPTDPLEFIRAKYPTTTSSSSSNYLKKAARQLNPRANPDDDE